MVALGPGGEGALEHLPGLFAEFVVDVAKATVVELLADEACVLPGPVEENASKRQLGDPQRVLAPHALFELIAGPVLRHRPRQRFLVGAGADVLGYRGQLGEQALLKARVQLDMGVQRLRLVLGVLGEQAGEAAKLLDQEIDVDAQLVAFTALLPWSRFTDCLDLRNEIDSLVGEQGKEALECLEIGARLHFAVRETPERQQREGERRIVTLGRPPVDAELAQVEENAEVEVTLIYIGANLSLVVG